MSTSPASSSGASCSISLSTTAAGIMIHTARGFSSLATKSAERVGRRGTFGRELLHGTG